MKYKLAKLNDANGDLSRQWHVYYYYEHPESGKNTRFRKWISNKIKTKQGRRQKAQEYINHINMRLRRGWNPFAEAETRLTNVIDAIDFAMKVKSATLGKRSRWTYNSVIRIFKRFLKSKKLDRLPVEEMNYAVAQEFCDYMLINENISKRTYNNRLTPLKTIFYFLQKREFIAFNPFENIDKLKVDEPEITAYTPEELALIAKTLPEYNYQLYVITQLVFYCFIRPAEIVRLQFKDVLMDQGIIVLPGHKSKNKKSEVIIMPERMIENLKDWHTNYPGDYYIFSRNLQPGTFEVAPTRIAGAWRKYADIIGIKKGVYDFKHTGNGFAFDQGLNSRDIQLQNRHSSLEETQRYLNKFRRVASDTFKESFSGY